MTDRVGVGIDVHRFGADRVLFLAGLEWPGEPGLEGHSDADVGRDRRHGCRVGGGISAAGPARCPPR